MEQDERKNGRDLPWVGLGLKKKTKKEKKKKNISIGRVARRQLGENSRGRRWRRSAWQMAPSLRKIAMFSNIWGGMFYPGGNWTPDGTRRERINVAQTFWNGLHCGGRAGRIFCSLTGTI